MSKEYDEYLHRHRDNVMKAVEWILRYIPRKDLIDVFPDFEDREVARDLICNARLHDATKNDLLEEYRPYDAYFYGERSEKVEKAFNYAWCNHQHYNSHHWQYWVLLDDDHGENIPLEMPDVCIVEMVADWWSFSFNPDPDKGGLIYLEKVFDWYNEYKDIMILHEKTRQKVELLLHMIKDSLIKPDDEELEERMRNWLYPLYNGNRRIMKSWK